MNYIFFDLEAINPEPDRPEHIPTFKDKLLRRKIKKFQPLTQIIVCIGVAINDAQVEVLSGPESELLTRFWELAKDTDLFVGFGVFDYDLKLIWQRSIINHIQPTIDIQFIKGTSTPIYDISYEWAKWSGGVGSKISLENLANLLQIPSPKNGDVTGRTVAKAYNEGKHQAIYDYCARDVVTTRAIYKKITFQNA